MIRLNPNCTINLIKISDIPAIHSRNEILRNKDFTRYFSSQVTLDTASFDPDSVRSKHALEIKFKKKTLYFIPEDESSLFLILLIELQIPEDYRYLVFTQMMQEVIRLADDETKCKIYLEYLPRLADEKVVKKISKKKTAGVLKYFKNRISNADLESAIKDHVKEEEEYLVKTLLEADILVEAN